MCITISTGRVFGVDDEGIEAVADWFLLSL